MEEGPPTPHDLLDNVMKLAQERARIRDKISAAISHSDDETLVSFNPFSDPEEVEQANNEANTPTVKLHSPEPAEVVSSIPPLKSSPPASPGKSRYIAIGSGVLICLLLFSGMFWLLQQLRRDSAMTSPPATTVRTSATQKSVLLPTPTSLPTPSPTPTPTPTPIPKPRPPVNLSFEDGSTGGWHSSSQDGTIDSIKNTTTSLTKDGKHVLMVTYDSDNDHSYPCIGTGNLPGTLKARQTITASILKQKGSRVQASLYVADRTGKWYTSSTYALVESTNTWYSMSFTVPSNFPGSANQVGIILFGDNAVVYIDNVSWH